MREIRLRDGAVWRLETVHDRRQKRLTYVWVACTNGDVEVRLMFAASWEAWPEPLLVAALEQEIARVTTGARL